MNVDKMILDAEIQADIIIQISEAEAEGLRWYMRFDRVRIHAAVGKGDYYYKN